MNLDRLLLISTAAALMLAACSSSVTDDGVAPASDPSVARQADRATEEPVTGPAGTTSADDRTDAPALTRPARIDPRDGGLEVVLGEWALKLEARSIRPGRVTFVVVNRGTVPHGFEIQAEGGDSSGHGSGDGLKAETRVLQAGERTRISLTLGIGVYKVECLVDGHDDLGMEGFLEVRKDAPFVRVDDRSGSGEIAIEGFAFDPPLLEVIEGTTVTWTNADLAPHTVTAEDGSFESGTLEPGRSFRVVIEGDGRVTYICLIHPEMTGTIVVG